MDAVNEQSSMRQLHLANLNAESASPTMTAATLQDSVRRLRQMTEGSSDHLVLLDRSLRVLFVNRDTAGVSPAQLTGRSIETVIPKRSRERALACMQRVLQQGAVDRFEVEWAGRSGIIRYSEVRVAPVREDGQVVALTLNGSDTTEHMLAQRAIATQAKMIESMLEGVALINEAGIVVITNPAFDALFGYARGMLISQSLAALAGGTPLDRCLLSALTGNTGPWPLEFDARRRDGGVVTVAGALSRLDDAGRTHLLLVLQDVSERKLLESAILEAVNREQYRIGNDLHDGLGQELTGIALMLRCLAGRLAVEHRHAVPDVESITRLVSNAVESTRSLARGLSPVNLERGGLRDALAGLAMHARSVYGIKVLFHNRLPVTMSLDDEMANHLYRIAQEAITNAVKHGKAKSVRLHLSAVHGRVRLSIVDDGTGLPADADSASGMGLRIMRYRARIARGDVRIEHSEPHGTRVVCECPIDTRALEKHQVLNSRGRSIQRIAAKRVSTKTAISVAKLASATLTKSRRRAKGEHK
jgi:PAS domain S-box-containing protein